MGAVAPVLDPVDDVDAPGLPAMAADAVSVPLCTASSAGIATRSQIESWDTEHLLTAAQAWSHVATVWESAFTEVGQQVSNPGGVPWLGLASEAAQHRAYVDRMTVISAADELHAASAIATTGAMEVKSAQQQALSSIARAEVAGFAVGDDLSVTYRGSVGSAVMLAVVQAQAQEFATDISAKAATLAAVDHQVATKIEAATTGVSTLNFGPEPPLEPGPDADELDALSVYDAEDVHRIVDPLPGGRRGHVKLVPSSVIRGLFEMLTENSVPAPALGYDGVWRSLEDGTRIGLREGSRSGGATIDIVYPGGEEQKIHVSDPPTRQPQPAPAPQPVPQPAPAPQPVPIPQPGPSPVAVPPAPGVEDLGPVEVAVGVVVGFGVALWSVGEFIVDPFGA